MTQISKEFFEKHKPKRLILLTEETREDILSVIANTSDFNINELFWDGSILLKYLNPKTRKRTNLKLINCFIEIENKKIRSFFETYNGDDVRVFFWEGRRSAASYDKRVFSDEELLSIDGELGSVKKYTVYECDRLSVPTGNFEKNFFVKTSHLAIEMAKKERPTELYYTIK